MSDIHIHSHTEPESEVRAFRAVVEAVLPRPPEAVFDYLANLENNPAWNWSVTVTTSLTPGPNRPGARYLQASAAEPGDPQILELSRLDPSRLLEVKATRSRSSATYRYELRPAEGDTTKVTVRAEVRPDHPVGLPDLFVERVRISIGANLDTLRTVLTHNQPDGGWINRRRIPRLRDE